MIKAAIAFLLTPLAFAHTITVSGAGFQLDGKPFPYTAVSFFNAIYNPAFNKSQADRREWMAKFQRYGINTLRIWGQWDCGRGFADACPECSLYFPDGRLRRDRVETAKQIASDADALGMVVELVLFSQESWHENIRLGKAEADRAVADLTREMMPYRNVTFQIWNEFDERTLEHVKTVKGIDGGRLVTNSPGPAGTLVGSPGEERALDYLSPHTSRQNAGRHWEIAVAEIAYLMKRFGKPVVDDEPARNGTASFGGPKTPTQPWDYILQIQAVWQLGAYATYHHDMFQTGYGTASVPPNGIPDPEFNPYHKAVFDFLALRDRYAPVWYAQR